MFLDVVSWRILRSIGISRFGHGAAVSECIEDTNAKRMHQEPTMAIPAQNPTLKTIQLRPRCLRAIPLLVVLTTAMAWRALPDWDVGDELLKKAAVVGLTGHLPNAIQESNRPPAFIRLAPAAMKVIATGCRVRRNKGGVGLIHHPCDGCCARSRASATGRQRRRQKTPENRTQAGRTRWGRPSPS